MIKETHRWPIKSFAFKSSTRPGWRNWWRNFPWLRDTCEFPLLNHFEFFSCILLIGNYMIFLLQVGINKHLKIFRPQIALTLRARAILLVFEKFTRAYLFQIALEIMWLPYKKKKTTNKQKNKKHRTYSHKPNKLGRKKKRKSKW